MYNDKVTKSVANAVRQVAEQRQPEILNEELKGNQHKIDANKNKKIDAHDFKLLRAKKEVKEESQELEEAMFPGTPEYEKKYGKAPQDMKKGEKKKTSQGEMEKTSKGVVHRRKFSEMVETYQSEGIKGLFEELQSLQEEASEEEFNTELQKQKDKAEGKGEKAKVAQPLVNASKSFNEESEQIEELQQLDELSKDTLKSYIKKSKEDRAERRDEADSARATGDYETQKRQSAKATKRVYGEISAEKRLNKEESEQIEERELSDNEMEKREKYVKSMKKGLEGFKQRYGDRAKEVMYATATKMAKKD